MARDVRFYIWEPYIEGYQVASALSPVNLGIKEAASIATGKRLSQIPEGIMFTDLTPGPVPDVMSTGGSGLLVSALIRGVIDQYLSNEKVQFITADLMDVPDEHRWLVNVLDVLPCIDREESELTFFRDFPGSIDGIKRLVPLPLVDAPALFHMEEIITTLIVREDLMSAMQQESSSCASFVLLEEFTRPRSERD